MLCLRESGRGRQQLLPVAAVDRCERFARRPAPSHLTLLLHPHFLPSLEQAAAELCAYRAEYEGDRSWEALAEDEDGRLIGVGVDPAAAAAAARRLRRATAAAGGASATAVATAAAPVRRGVIRAVAILVDLSSAAATPDFRPTRAAAAAAAVAAFTRAFFDRNPLSHLALLAARGGRAERLTELGGSPEAHIARLAASLSCAGSASLLNGLEALVAALAGAPPYASREALILFSGLATCDPGDIGPAIAAARDARVRVSVIGLAAEVHVCKRIADGTGGSYSVALDEGHLADLALSHAPAPPLRSADAASSLVVMGFPSRAPPGPRGAAFIGPLAKLGGGGFACARCGGRVAELPTACHVCGLTLVAAPHLARSYHHLFPPPVYTESVVEEVVAEGRRARVEAGVVAAAAAAVALLPGGRRRVKAEGGGAAAAPPSPPTAAARLATRPRCYGCLLPLDTAAEAVGGTDSTAAAAASSLLGAALADGAVLTCRGACARLFCGACDGIVHDLLHVCPGCEACSGEGAGASAPVVAAAAAVAKGKGPAAAAAEVEVVMVDEERGPRRPRAPCEVATVD